MKNYKKILEQHKGQNFELIENSWGQNYLFLYNSIVKSWQKLNIGEKIFVLSYKKFGLKSALKFFKSKGLEYRMVGKGKDGLRLVEIEKTSDKKLKLVERENIIEFEFNNQEYNADVGEAVFSKTGLDKGTRFLLNVVVKEMNLNNKTIGDLGCGWGAISLVLTKEFPKINIIAIEKELSSFDVAEKNLSVCQNVKMINGDLFDTKDGKIKKYHNELDYIISNPPFHVTEDEKMRFFKTAKLLLKVGGKIVFVVEGSFVDRFRKTTVEYFKMEKEIKQNRYVVFIAKKES